MKLCTLHERWTLWMPDHIADWDVLTYWERPRVASMEANLRRGMILYDVGAEHGMLSGINAQLVGGENMVLMEPSPDFWPSLRLVWEMNGLGIPAGCWAGLVSDRIALPDEPDFDPAIVNGWPGCAWQGPEAVAMPYRYLHNEKHARSTPTITLDAWADFYGVLPAALTIDVEGAEHLVLRGAVTLLSTVRPLVWVSVHPDLMVRDFGVSEDVLWEFVGSVGYRAALINVDHESHYVLWHPDAHDPVLP